MRGNALRAGLAELSHGKLILLLTLTTALLGVSAAMPLGPVLRESVAGTLAGDHFLRNAPRAAPTDFVDLVRENWTAFQGTARATLWAGLLGVLLQAFFAGGLVAALGRGPFSFSQFFEPARGNFWHNVKCFLLFGPAAALVLGAWLAGEHKAAQKLLRDTPPDSPLHSLAGWGAVIVALLLFAVLSLLYDFARAARRHAPAIGAFRAYRFAWRALSGSWLPALGLWLAWLSAAAAATLSFLALAWAVPAVSPPAIVLLFALQLAGLAARSAARVGAWGSFLAFLEPRAPAALSAITRIRFREAGGAPGAARPAPRRFPAAD
jgi:hypothetical protein